MRWLYSKWFGKVFLTVCWLLLIGSILGFVFVGGYILLLFISELQNASIFTKIKYNSKDKFREVRNADVD